MTVIANVICDDKDISLYNGDDNFNDYAHT